MFNVFYDQPREGKVITTKYLTYDVDMETALDYLGRFKKLYLNPDGTGRPYPNGKGTYPFTNARILPSS